MIRDADIVDIKITDFLAGVLSGYQSSGKFNRHTIDKEQFSGICGEYAFDNWLEFNWLDNEWKGSEKGSFDFWVGKNSPVAVDVKVKKRTDRANLSHCDCHVEERQLATGCHIYVFGSFCPDINVVELLGWIKKSEFIERARVWKEGEADERGFVQKRDSRTVKAETLYPMSDLANKVANLDRAA